MAITATEGFQRGDLDSNSGSTSWVVTCADTDTMADVRDAVWSAASASFAGLVLVDVRVKHVLDTLYLCDAIYNRAERTNVPQKEAEGYVLDFDTTGQTQHINSSLSHTLYKSPTYCPAGDEEDQGVIGFDGKKIAGIDIIIGVYNFTEEWTLPASTVNATYRANLAYLTGKVNDAAFRTFEAGEVMFMGATGRRVNGGKFSVSFKFAVSKNKTGLTVGDITGIAKTGWQYEDIRYTDGLLETAIAQVPKQVKIHTVYEQASFAMFPSVT